MAPSVREIEATLAREKAQLRRSIGDLSDAAKATVDVREHYRHHTLAMLGGAAAAGFVVGVVSARDRSFSVSGHRSRVGGARGRRLSGGRRRSARPVFGALGAIVAQRVVTVAEDLLRAWLVDMFSSRRRR